MDDRIGWVEVEVRGWEEPHGAALDERKEGVPAQLQSKREGKREKEVKIDSATTPLQITSRGYSRGLRG